jgi:hypothetical protein
MCCPCGSLDVGCRDAGVASQNYNFFHANILNSVHKSYDVSGGQLKLLLIKNNDSNKILNNNNSQKG